MSATKTTKYKGFVLPSDVAQEIAVAAELWRERDRKSWEFAEQAYKVVGHYIPEATKALARAMGVKHTSSPEGYAKAHELKQLLQLAMDHEAPLLNLFISHYVIVGKSVSAQIRKLVSDGNTDEDSQFQILLWADGLLQEASRKDWTVEDIRQAIAKGGKPTEDSFVNSVNIIIPMIENHIINTSYYGINEFRASVAARIGRIFIHALKWATGQDQQKPTKETETQVDLILQASEKIFHQ